MSNLSILFLMKDANVLEVRVHPPYRNYAYTDIPRKHWEELRAGIDDIIGNMTEKEGIELCFRKRLKPKRKRV